MTGAGLGRPPQSPALPESVPLAVELVQVRLPMLEPFVSSHGVEHDREVVLVRAVDDDGFEGWGECSALSRPTYSSEYTEGSWEVLRDRLVPAALQGERRLDVAFPMASAGLEVACVDLALRAAGVSLADEFGAAGSRVPVGVVVGITDSIDDLLVVVERRLVDGYRQIKLKIRPGWDLEPLRAVRDGWPAVGLAADANGSFDVGDLAPLVAQFDSLGLDYLEQPLPAADLEGLSQLSRNMATPIALDESIMSPDEAGRALDSVVNAVVNLKPARIGGLGQSRVLISMLAERSVPAFVGGMLETGVGRAVALAVASSPHCTLVSDLGPSTRYFAHDLTEPFEMTDGMLTVPSGPGAGVTVDPDRVDDVAVRRLMIDR